MNNPIIESFSVVTDKEQWTYYLHKSFEFDFYHTWHYHSLDERGTPLLFVYEEDDDFVAIPFLKREIEGANLFDLTSVYGYSGPVSNRRMTDIPELMKLNFGEAFKDFLRRDKVISVFSRLHPFLQQNMLLNQLGGLQSNGKTVYIDFSVSLEEQRKNYNKRLLRQIRQLRKKSYTIKEAVSEEEVEMFTDIYRENMDRLYASSEYYYSKEYFQKLVNNQNLSCKLVLVYDDCKVICGAIVGCSKCIIRNHLSATHKDYIKDSPSKLLTDEISVIGREMGLHYFHLGGGVGGKEDSLFAFKSSFSPLFLDDYIWCYIANEEAYQLLVQQNNIQANHNQQKFFPLYRVKPQAS
ncbi:GNAT family N-acetyltransferase [Pseudoxanthomonas sp. SGD-10]|nr:GNAT family N-acetyltransferase [Pseudoxanthomonas sp. SGD-10]